MTETDPIAECVRMLTRLPGVGEKSARRMVYALLSGSPEVPRAIGTALQALHARVRRCARCGVFTGEEICALCRDPRRGDDLLCVVARPWDVDAFERSGAYRGRYHVLHTLLDPLGGVGPAEFPLAPVLARIEQEGFREVIVATPATVEGEATALYLAETLRARGVRVSRIASGVPHGGDLEYVDPITLGRAVEGRRTL